MVSDGSVNSYGVRVRTAGIDLRRFTANPIMLFNHLRFSGNPGDILPIGNWEGLRIEGDAMFATPVFDVADEFAAKIEGKYDRGVLRGASVSVYPLEVELTADGVPEITLSELHEMSIADIPSNANSVVVLDKNTNQPLELNALIKLAAGSSSSKINVPMSVTYANVPALLGLSTGASEEAVAGEINKLITLKAENETLKGKLLKLAADEAARLKAGVEDLLTLAIADNRITAEDKPKWEKMLTADFATSKELLESLPKRLKLSEIPRTKTNPGNVEDVYGFTVGGKTWDDLDKSGELALLKASDPDSYQKLYESEFGKTPK